MARITTPGGFECEPKGDELRDDWEYIEALEGITEGRVTAYTRLAQLLLTPADYKALKEHCTGENGRVSAGKMCRELLEIIKLMPSGKNS